LIREIKHPSTLGIASDLDDEFHSLADKAEAKLVCMKYYRGKDTRGALGTS
jgi:hypothetical protein